MTSLPSIARTYIPAVLLAALCAWAEPNGYLERVEATPELRAELDRYGLEAGVYVQPQAGCDSAAASRTRFARVNGHPFPSSISYLLFTPRVADGHKAPLLLYIPGSGERGEDLMRHFHHRTLFERVTSDEFQTRHPCYLLSLSPPEETDTFLDCEPGRPSAIHDILAGAVAAVVATNCAPPIDTNRIYATGLSFGGEGVYGLAFSHPGLFAACVPVGAAPPPAYFASAESPGSWWHFHNEGDYRARGVAASGLDAFREAVEAAGGEFRTGTYPAKDHNAWDAAWSEDALWDWVFSKALGDGHTGPSGTTPPNAPVRAGRPLVVCTASRPGRDWTTGPERAADGLDGTTYMPDRSVGRGEWLQAEFPDGVSGRIAVLTGITEDGRRRHRLREGHLEVSPDGEAWESVGSFSPETGECEAALPGTVRFVRVVTDNATPKKIAIRRFVVTP